MTFFLSDTFLKVAEQSGWEVKLVSGCVCVFINKPTASMRLVPLIIWACWEETCVWGRLSYCQRWSHASVSLLPQRLWLDHFLSKRLGTYMPSKINSVIWAARWEPLHSTFKSETKPSRAPALTEVRPWMHRSASRAVAFTARRLQHEPAAPGSARDARARNRSCFQSITTRCNERLHNTGEPGCQHQAGFSWQ